MFKKLEHTVQIKKYQRQIESARVCKVWREVIEKVYPKIAPHTEAISFRNSMLTIKTTSPVVANELQMRNDSLRRLINEQIKSEAVEKIIYRQ